MVVHGLSCSQAGGISPGSGIEPASLALAGRFLTTESPGKPLTPTLCSENVQSQVGYLSLRFNVLTFRDDFAVATY